MKKLFKKFKKTAQVQPVSVEPEPHYQTKPCAVCAQEKPVHLFAEVPGCGHQFCQNCIVDWVEASFQGQMLHESIELSCPMSCGQNMTYQDLISITSQQDLRDRIETQYLKKYIHDSPDIVSCPNRHCHNAGIIIKKPCNQQLTCNNCGSRWKDPSQYTCWDKTRNLLNKRPTLRGSETWSNLSKVLFTIACPKCGVYIQKNGGCPHMQCSKCTHQFCWHCHGPHYNYQHQRQNNCGVRNIKLFVAYFSIFLLCFLRVAQWFPVMLSWPMALLYWVAVVIATGVVCWFGVVLPVIGFLGGVKDLCSPSFRYLCPMVCGTSIYIPLAYLFWNNFCYFQFGRDMWIIFTLGVVILLVVLCFALVACCCKATCRRR